MSKQWKVRQLVEKPLNGRATGRMKFDLHPGDTFVSLEADDRPAQPGHTFGTAWGQLLWVPTDCLKAA